MGADHLEHLRGIDSDEALLQHAIRSVDPALSSLDPAAPRLSDPPARLRRACVRADKALSVEVETLLRMSLPGLTTALARTGPHPRA